MEEAIKQIEETKEEPKKEKKIFSDEQKAAIRKIWEQYKGQYKLTYIFTVYLRDYFEVPEKVSMGKSKDAEFMRFVSMARDWGKEERRYQTKVKAENLSEDEVSKIDENNRKNFVLLIQDMIDNYRKNPDSFKQISASDIVKIHQVLKQIDNANERLEVQRGKLKLEAAKSFLPYTRMSRNDLIETSHMITESINQLIELDEKKLPSGVPGEGGELPAVE